MGISRRCGMSLISLGICLSVFGSKLLLSLYVPWFQSIHWGTWLWNLLGSNQRLGHSVNLRNWCAETGSEEITRVIFHISVDSETNLVCFDLIGYVIDSGWGCGQSLKLLRIRFIFQRHMAWLKIVMYFRLAILLFLDCLAQLCEIFLCQPWRNIWLGIHLDSLDFKPLDSCGFWSGTCTMTEYFGWSLACTSWNLVLIIVSDGSRSHIVGSVRFCWSLLSFCDAKHSSSLAHTSWSLHSCFSISDWLEKRCSFFFLFLKSQSSVSF